MTECTRQQLSFQLQEHHPKLLQFQTNSSVATRVTSEENVIHPTVAIILNITTTNNQRASESCAHLFPITTRKLIWGGWKIWSFFADATIIEVKEAGTVGTLLIFLPFLSCMDVEAYPTTCTASARFGSALLTYHFLLSCRLFHTSGQSLKELDF